MNATQPGTYRNEPRPRPEQRVETSQEGEEVLGSRLRIVTPVDRILQEPAYTPASAEIREGLSQDSQLQSQWDDPMASQISEQEAQFAVPQASEGVKLPSARPDSSKAAYPPVESGVVPEIAPPMMMEDERLPKPTVLPAEQIGAMQEPEPVAQDGKEDEEDDTAVVIPAAEMPQFSFKVEDDEEALPALEMPAPSLAQRQPETQETEQAPEIDFAYQKAIIDSYMKKEGLDEFNYGGSLYIRRAGSGEGFEVRYPVKECPYQPLTEEVMQKLQFDVDKQPRPLSWKEYQRLFPEASQHGQQERMVA